MKAVGIGELFKAGWEIYRGNFLPLTLAFTVMCLVSLTIVPAPALLVAFFMMLINAHRGQIIVFSDLFSRNRDIKRYFKGALLALLVLIAGFLVCIAGVAVAGAILLMFFPMMADKGMKHGQALEQCWILFKREWKMLLMLLPLTTALALSGLFVFLIGFFITAPLAISVVAVAYEQLYGSLEDEPEPTWNQE